MSQILTVHEFTDMTRILAEEQNALNPQQQTSLLQSNGKKLRLPKCFTMQAYIEPKLDCRYVTYYDDDTKDKLMHLRPDIDFHVFATKYHNYYRIDDYYTKIKVQK